MHLYIQRGVYLDLYIDLQLCSPSACIQCMSELGSYYAKLNERAILHYGDSPTSKYSCGNGLALYFMHPAFGMARPFPQSTMFPVLYLLKPFYITHSQQPDSQDRAVIIFWKGMMFIFNSFRISLIPIFGKCSKPAIISKQLALKRLETIDC